MWPTSYDNTVVPLGDTSCILERSFSPSYVLLLLLLPPLDLQSASIKEGEKKGICGSQTEEDPQEKAVTPRDFEGIFPRPLLDASVLPMLC